MSPRCPPPEQEAKMIPKEHPVEGIKSIAVIGNYLPRQCGIATFTRDLVEGLSDCRLSL